MTFECKLCGKKFNKKANMINHMNRKFKCNATQNNPPKTFSCQHCKKTFTRKYTLNRHIELRCKKQIEETDILNKLLAEMQELKAAQKSQQLINVNQQPINVNVENLTLNINIVPFGMEDLDKIEPHICKQILNKGFRAIERLIEHIHFNKNMPEYHNCYISNMRDKYAVVYDGTKWKLIDVHEAIADLKDNKQYYLENKFEEFYESLDENTKTKFNRFLSEKDTNDVENQIKENIKLILYNNKDVPMATKNALAITTY